MPSLPKQLVRLNEGRSAFVDTLDALSSELRTSKPEPEKWSPGDVTEHVYKSELGSLKWLEKQLDREHTPRIVGNPSRIKFVTLVATMRSPLKFKVPPGAASAVPVGMSYDDIRADWAGFSERWAALIESFPPELRHKGLANHPIIGPMTFSQTIGFLAAHAERHFKQLERTIKVLKFSKG